jgi:hypothetical protein
MPNMNPAPSNRIDLPTPTVACPTLRPRRHCRQRTISRSDAAVLAGGAATLSVQGNQSTTATANVDATILQIAELAAASCSYTVKDGIR